MNLQSFTKTNKIKLTQTITQIKESAIIYNKNISTKIDELVKEGCTKLLEQQTALQKEVELYNSNRWFGKKDIIKVRELDFYIDYILVFYTSYYFYDKEFISLCRSYNKKYDELFATKIDINRLDKLLDLTYYGPDIYLTNQDASFLLNCSKVLGTPTKTLLLG